MKNFALLIVALILALILTPIGILFSIIEAIRYQRTWRKINLYLAQICLECALGIDKLGNAACGDFFNALMIEKGGYHFGVGHETISSALGKNQLRGTLSGCGLALANLLDWLDKDHCINSIDNF